MHELSIANSILEIVTEVAEKEGALTVKVIHLEIGELSCVADAALNFAFEVAREGTLAEHAELAIHRHPVKVRCTPCDKVVALKSTQSFRCPECDTPTAEIVSGRELEVSRVELVEGELATH